jgi:hypothetical protein
MGRDGALTPDPIPVDALQERLLPVADLVMVLMLSRPQSGSLRDTRVTIVTIWLAVAVALVAMVLAILGLALGTVGRQPLWIIPTVALLPLAAGCADLGVFGIRQRLLMGRR